ncbi:RagB/SusD family nutrient uptake outer membrane protein [Bacteroides eggerthii]|jgi:hypothetical protein|uniref:RagB/SusD family nutrient uptake outer membrane protein n=1 Tax=Bacteroides eggerthii TaxID=28111 RepID=UPI00321BB416
MKTIRKIISLGLLVTMIVGCEDLKFGNSFLEKPQGDEKSIDSVFSQKRYADQALNQFYKSLPDYMPALGGYHDGAFTLDLYSDLGYTTRLSWTHGAVTSASGTSNFPYQLSNKAVTGDPTYGIRKAYIYIENVDKVPDMSADEKKVRKAEAKVVIGYHYMDMIRYYGGMPWIDHAYTADELFQFPRLTLEETVERTVNLLDEAARDLPWFTTDAEYGHMTAAVAKALKFRLLMFVASPLFNNVTPYYEGPAATEHLTWYGDYQESRWEAALEAGREFLRMNEENGDYYRVENTGNPRTDYINGYFTKGNREVVMASFRWGVYAKGNKSFRMFDQGYGMPRGNHADMFLWHDGSKFDWNNPEHRAHPFFDASGNPTRDIRLYETLVVNGDKYKGRKAEVFVGGSEGFGPGAKEGQKFQFGYGFRKFIRDKANEMDKKPYSCPLIRMPEIYLYMAEAMNKLGQASVKDEFKRDAYDYLNLVHTRAGLPGVTAAEVPDGEPLLNYLLDERAREFGQEDIRNHDMRRYLKGSEWATRPLEELVTTKVGENSFNYQVNVREEKYYWYDHWYLLPFPLAEINKKYGLVQNPGW